MNTLLLRLSGAMQSWGVQSRFGMRDTGLEPSKSGALGLVCAALGIDRADDESLAPLAALKMGVRVDREGVLKVDYHTAGESGYLRAGNDVERKNVILSNRYYLADALFLVGLAGNDLVLLERIHTALRNPVWPLFLGRKAFVPGELLWLEDGLKPGKTLVDALKEFHSLSARPAPERLRLVLEDQQDGSVVRSDQPLSFAQGNRRFAPRRLTVVFMPAPVPLSLTEVA
ncbi:MAG: type I-E CRISPR-associated protein Cas5/CasD [Chloroflexota bacterium]